MQTADRLLTAAEAAEYLGVSVPHLCGKYLRKGYIRAAKLGANGGGRWKIRKSEIDAYLARKAEESRFPKLVEVRRDPDNPRKHAVIF